MIRTNRDRIVVKAVLGRVTHPRIPLRNPWLVDPAGCAHVKPGTGGITYNVMVGDSAFDFEGDHVEPCVSIAHEDTGKDPSTTGGLSILSCIGNEARITSGAAAGGKGIVTGKHGGVEHVLVDFPPATLEKLSIGDRILVRAAGQGLSIPDLPDVHVMNIDPALLDACGISIESGRLVVPVAHVIPATIMGSGVGSRHAYSGDYDIQIPDDDVVREHGLQSLRIGDVIAIRDADCRFGRTVRKGAMSIGVVVHGSCVTSGHGPGVTVVMTTAGETMVPEIEGSANIASYLGIGRGRRKPKRRQRRSTGG
ncbi:MAG: DUF4438 domain-containing protein [Candidatus Krumholzibacteriota bacterium]|nr:DUF4438 domain-containing protein [Candidatus Krumholzibacteriota bacterium]